MKNVKITLITSILVSISILFLIFFFVKENFTNNTNNTFGEYYLGQFKVSPVIKNQNLKSFNLFDTPLNYNPGNGQLFKKNMCLEAPKTPGNAIVSACKVGYAPQQDFVYDENNKLIFNPYYGLVLKNDNTFQFGTRLYNLYNNNTKRNKVSESYKFNILRNI